MVRRGLYDQLPDIEGYTHDALRALPEETAVEELQSAQRRRRVTVGTLGGIVFLASMGVGTFLAYQAAGPEPDKSDLRGGFILTLVASLWFTGMYGAVASDFKRDEWDRPLSEVAQWEDVLAYKRRNRGKNPMDLFFYTGKRPDSGDKRPGSIDGLLRG